MNLEDEIAKTLSDEIAREIDFSILADVLCSIGWTKVVLNPMSSKHSVKVDYWVQRYVKGNFKTLGSIWLFEESKDATMFILRWSS